jgi:uncharacterized protein YunC (DUF1805 family)
MVETEIIETSKGAALGIKVSLQKAPLLIIRGERGYLGCGYFNPKTVEKLGDSAAIVTGVKSFRDMLRAEVKYATKAARKRGVKKGMKGIKALELFH